jgi:hypothetical protein
MSWNSWLNEKVAWDITEYIPRGTAIQRLCNQGLVPFLESHGYAVAISPKDLGSRVATGLYNNMTRSHLESEWSFGPVENSSMSDDYEVRYRHVISSDEWQKFWSIWGVWSDFDTERHYGWDRQRDVEDYIWTQIDAEGSRQTAIVNEFLSEEYVPEHDSRDAYLRDAAESNEWGGRRR